MLPRLLVLPGAVISCGRLRRLIRVWQRLRSGLRTVLVHMHVHVAGMRSGMRCRCSSGRDLTCLRQRQAHRRRRQCHVNGSNGLQGHDCQQ